MWLEAIVSKAQWEQSRRTPPRSVCTSPVSGRSEYRAFGRRSFQNLFQLLNLDQWNVARNDERAVYATRFTVPGCHLDGIGLAAICIVGNDLKFELPGQLNRKRIAGDDANLWPACPCSQRFQDIEKHRPR